MPKYYCDYCDTFLTHDSPSVRKTHCTGRKHKDNVKFFYQSWMEQQAQHLIDATTGLFAYEIIEEFFLINIISFFIKSCFPSWENRIEPIRSTTTSRWNAGNAWIQPNASTSHRCFRHARFCSSKLRAT